MQDFFTFLYELFIGEHPNQAALVRSEVFAIVGLVTLGVTILFVLFYYYVMNSLSTRAKYNYTGYWALFLLINSMVAFFIALNKIAERLEVHFDDYESYFYMFGVENAFYSMVFFLLFSLLLKTWSKHAPYVPFRFPLK
jgi:peptidoglycan biosynthesis protein MviN/MurJ (putative lipid II flippase)